MGDENKAVITWSPSATIYLGTLAVFFPGVLIIESGATIAVDRYGGTLEELDKVNKDAIMTHLTMTM